MIFQEFPRPPQIARSPELASLALLDTALEIAGAALIAANPELGSTDDSDIVTGQACITEALLAQAEATQVLIKRYAALVERQTRPVGLVHGNPADDF